MENTTIHHILNFLVQFQRDTPGAARVHYGDLRGILDTVMDREQMEMAVSAYFDRLGNEDNPSASGLISGNVLRAAEQLSDVITPKEKLLLLLVIIRSLPVTPNRSVNEHTASLLQIARTLKISDNDAGALLNLALSEEPDAAYLVRSVCVTGEMPDYNRVLDGYRVIFQKGIEVSLWFMKFDSCDLVLARILSNNTTFKSYSVRAGDILPVNNLLTEFLSLNKVDFTEVIRELNSPLRDVPFVHIPSTETTPDVVLDPVNCRVVVTGHSVCVTPRIYYDPILKWIERLRVLSPRRIEMHMHLDYFNTYSSKVILEIFFRLRKYSILGWDVVFFWYYAPDDDDLRETGENYADILGGDFRVMERDKKELYQIL